MKLAIISDTHFGDEMCQLVNHHTLDKGPKYDAFFAAAGKDNDFLILLGDIFDFSISNYGDAYRVAKAFFKLIQKDQIAKNIIYVPGNHDFDMWTNVQHQFKIIYQVNKGRPAKPFQWSLPGVIDDREGSATRGFMLPGVIDGIIDPNIPPLGAKKSFLNNITKNENGSGGKPTNFYFAYPNLYLAAKGKSYLITHGQYLEAYWSLAGEWIRNIAQKDLKGNDPLNLDDIVALNSPLCQLACSGIGQAGILTALVNKIQREVKDGNPGRVRKYLDRLDDDIDKLTTWHWYDPKSWGKELLTDLVSNKAKDQIMESIENSRGSRYSKEFMKNKGVQARFMDYFRFSRLEMKGLKDSHGRSLRLPEVRRVIFGHTHRPNKWKSRKAIPLEVDNRSVKLHNTGGWLTRKVGNTTEFCGAAVFTYDSATGFDSIEIDVPADN
ncbi:MAG: hypothetical protein GY841_18755 [FCB group bacterium]|nr:hypothetical protein [FCB group bacterium]